MIRTTFAVIALAVAGMVGLVACRENTKSPQLSVWSPTNDGGCPLSKTCYSGLESGLVVLSTAPCTFEGEKYYASDTRRYFSCKPKLQSTSATAMASVATGEVQDTLPQDLRSLPMVAIKDMPVGGRAWLIIGYCVDFQYHVHLNPDMKVELKEAGHTFNMERRTGGYYYFPERKESPEGDCGYYPIIARIAGKP